MVVCNLALAVVFYLHAASGQFASRPFNRDVAEGADLTELHMPLPPEFKHGKEVDDEARATGEAARHISEQHRPRTGKLLAEVFQGIADLEANRSEMAHIHLRIHCFVGGAEVGFQQIGRGGAFQRVGVETPVAFFQADLSGDGTGGGFHAVLHVLRGVAESAAFYEASEEEVFFFPAVEVVQQVVIGIFGQQAAALEMHQGCGDHEEVGDFVQGEVVQLGDVGVYDFHDANLQDVQLAVSHDVEQQTDGARELVPRG